MKATLLLTLLSGITFRTALPAAAAGRTTPGIPQQVIRSASFLHSFRPQAYTDPAARFFRQDSSLTSLRFTAFQDKATALRLAPAGDGNRMWGFEAASHYLMEDNHRVWGEASYHRGVRKNVTWSETSDYELLYPYVMADESGGDMDYEQYDLSGGYAGRWKQWVFGAGMGYRARSEYRTKDPRPNNTVADLQARLAAGYIIGSYELSAAVSAGKYKQTNELKYFNELGASKEYHLTGLGTEFVRFSGACNNVFYKGHHVGASLDLVPVNRLGISASVLYDRFAFDKVLSDLNRLALNHVDEDRIETELTWTQATRHNGTYGIKADGIYTRRNGIDNLYGDATGNVYPQIGETQMFRNRQTGIRLSGFYEQTLSRNYTLGISPSVRYSQVESSHAESGNRFDTEQLTYGATFRAAYTRKRHFVQLSLTGKFRNSQGTTLSMDPEMIAHADLAEQLTHFARYLRHKETHAGIRLHYEYKLRPSTLTCFIEGSWEHLNFFAGQHHADCCFLTTGVRL